MLEGMAQSKDFNEELRGRGWECLYVLFMSQCSGRTVGDPI